MLKHRQSLFAHIDKLDTTDLPLKLTRGQRFLELVDSSKLRSKHVLLIQVVNLVAICGHAHYLTLTQSPMYTLTNLHCRICQLLCSVLKPLQFT